MFRVSGGDWRPTPQWLFKTGGHVYKEVWMYFDERQAEVIYDGEYLYMARINKGVK